MRALKTIVYVGLAAGLMSLNVLTYRQLQEQRIATGQLSTIISVGQMDAARLQLMQARLSMPSVPGASTLQPITTSEHGN